MVVRKVISKIVSETGAYLIPRAYKAFRRYDVRITNQLFGKSGGKGFRHGRDIGLTGVTELFTGENELDDGISKKPDVPFTPRPKYQTRNRQYGRGNRYWDSRDRCYKYRGKSNKFNR